MECEVSNNACKIICTDCFKERVDINKQKEYLKSKGHFYDSTLKEYCWKYLYGIEGITSKCFCCSNAINPFNFHAAHNVPDSKGGELSTKNLYPTCRECNLKMGNRYTVFGWRKRIRELKDELFRNKFTINSPIFNISERLGNICF